MPIGFPPGLTPHSFLSARGQEQSFVVQKNTSSGKPTGVAWRTTMSSGARGALGVVSSLTSRLAGQFSSWASKETPAGRSSAFCQSRWSCHTWIQDICFSPREKGCAKHSLVSFSVKGLVWLLNFRGGHERRGGLQPLLPHQK